MNSVDERTVILLCLGSFAMSVAAGAAVFWFRRLFEPQAPNRGGMQLDFVSNANVAAAGVLIAMSLQHILCEALINLEHLLSDQFDQLRLLKISTMVYFLGFLVMFVVEKLCIRHRHDDHIERHMLPPLHHATTTQHSSSARRREDERVAAAKKSDDAVPLGQISSHHRHGGQRGASRATRNERARRIETYDMGNSSGGGLVLQESEDDDDERSIVEAERRHEEHIDVRNGRSDAAARVEIGRLNKESDAELLLRYNAEYGDNARVSIDNIQGYMKKKYRSELFSQVFIFLSMSLHSLVAGMGASFSAAGGQSDDTNSSLVLSFLVISFMVHKVMDVSIVAKGLVELQVRRLVYLLFILCFSFMTPVGIMLGSYIRHQDLDRTALAFLYFLQLFTGGIFLYIALIEIFIEHFIEKPRRFRKLLIFLFFYALVSLVSYVD